MKLNKFRVFDGVDYMSKPFTLAELQEGKIQFTKNTEVMQFTGLTDRNGKEIYEGDNKTHTPFVEDFNQWRVIGNIYENPELLDGSN